MNTDTDTGAAATSQPPTNDTPNEPAAAAPAVKVFDLTDVQREFLKEHLEAGWVLHDRREQPVKMKLRAPQLASLGKVGADIDEQLHEKRQGKNARQAALIRERNERQGAIHSLSARLRSGVDEISKEMTIDQQAAYSQRVAALREELDNFEAARKEEMTELKEELAELEAQQQAISKKIRDGHGDVRVEVIDLIHYESGVVMILRLEDGALVAKRALNEHERQLTLFQFKAELPPLDEHEYTLAVSGRILDASRNYAERCRVSFDEAKKAVRQMLPDEDLPPEDPPRTEAGKAAMDASGKVESKEDGADVEETDSVEDTSLPDEADVAAEEAAADAERAEPDPDALYDVVIDKLRPDAVTVKVIKAVANVRGIKVKDAKDLLQVFPVTVLEGADQAAADSLVEELNALGASVSAVMLDATPDEDEDGEPVDLDGHGIEDEAPVDGIHRADDPTEGIGFGKRR